MACGGVNEPEAGLAGASAEEGVHLTSLRRGRLEMALHVSFPLTVLLMSFSFTSALLCNLTLAQRRRKAAHIHEARIKQWNKTDTCSYS